MHCFLVPGISSPGMTTGPCLFLFPDGGISYQIVLEHLVPHYLQEPLEDSRLRATSLLTPSSLTTVALTLLLQCTFSPHLPHFVSVDRLGTWHFKVSLRSVARTSVVPQLYDKVSPTWVNVTVSDVLWKEHKCRVSVQTPGWLISAYLYWRTCDLGPQQPTSSDLRQLLIKDTQIFTWKLFIQLQLAISIGKPDIIQNIICIHSVQVSSEHQKIQSFITVTKQW